MMGPGTAPSSIEIRPIRTIEEYRRVEDLQRRVWCLEDAEIVPDHLLVTANKNGGVLLGAFDLGSTEIGSVEPLVGFVLGFVGLTPEGSVKHCSHMMGVDPDYQDRGLGYRLKLAQREHVLKQGLDLVTWTFDPLESRNAYLNFHKLGGTCNTYLRNLYGDMRDGLSGGLPSDRFQVEWHIASRRVEQRLRGEPGGAGLSGLRSAGVLILNAFSLEGFPHPPDDVLPMQGERFMIQIPADFQAIRTADMALAGAWRAHSRALFEAGFAAGYSAVDVLYEGGRSCYLLGRGEEGADTEKD